MTKRSCKKGYYFVKALFNPLNASVALILKPVN